MDFTLTETEELIRSSARTLLARECPASLVRAFADDTTVAAGLWQELHDWFDVADAPLVQLALFCEELGRSLAPVPFLAHAGTFVPVLRAAAHPIAGVAASGEVTGTVAVAGRSGEWVVNGDPVRTFVLDADRVDMVAIVLPGPSVAVVDPSELAPREVPTLDWTRRVFELDVSGVGDHAGVAVATAEPDVLEDALRHATVALAAELVGTARWLLDTTVAYVTDRRQFARPVGSFQAVQHQLADVALHLERATAAVYYAAMTVDAHDADRVRATHVAKAAASGAAKHAAKTGIQLHGGIGYTWDHDLHLYLRRAYASSPLMGDARWHHDRLAELLLEGTAAGTPGAPGVGAATRGDPRTDASAEAARAGGVARQEGEGRREAPAADREGVVT